MTPQELMTGLLAFCGAITSIGAAVVVVYKFIRELRSPEKVQNDRLDAIEKKQDATEKRLSELEKRENNSSDTLGLILDAQFALLSHGISGNAMSEMESARAELQKYLISKRDGGVVND